MSEQSPASFGGISIDALDKAITARKIAEDAQREIKNHEDICALRYQNIDVKLGDMKNDFGRIWKLFAWVGGSGFMLLMSVLGFLLKAQFDTITEMNKATTQRAEIQSRIDNAPPQVIIQRAPGQQDMGATIERQQQQQ